MKNEFHLPFSAVIAVLTLILCFINPFFIEAGAPKEPSKIRHEITIGGVVHDENGEALPGVNVLVKGTAQGTDTDADGRFSLIIPKDNAVLVFSYVGYKSHELTLTRTNTALSIRLTPDEKALDDVVVVGYGTQNTRNLATATSRLPATQIKNTIVNTVDQALQGRVTGVQVTETSGEPGAATVVRIRGNNSLSGNNEPLYVVDGFPMPTYSEPSTNIYGTTNQNGLFGINPNDIESMEVLKDASATAIYGSRGANGVILITTKAGKKGDGRIALVNKTSVGHIANPWKMMNSRQYAESMNESYMLSGYGLAFPNLDTTFTNTDWTDLITQNSLRQDVTLSISGGTPKTSYYVSGNYLFDRGTIINSDNSRASLRINLDNEINDWYTLKSQVSLVRQQTNRAITAAHAWPFNGGLMDGLRAPPTIERDYTGDNSAGIPGFASWFFANPEKELRDKTDLTFNDYYIINLENWFRLTSDLKLTVTLGANQNLTRRKLFMPETTTIGFSVNGSNNTSVSNTYSYNLNAYLSYDKRFGTDHVVAATLGTEYNSQQVEFLYTFSTGFSIPYFGLDNISSAQTATIDSYKELRKIQSGFFRANYSFKDRYIVNASVRLDGASPFAANRKLGWFPSVGLAWNFDSEPFIQSLLFLDQGKLRVSYGETGSQAIGPYSSLQQYDSKFYELGNTPVLSSTLFPVSLSNPNLSWERTRQLNIGLDMSLLRNKIILNLDYYVKRTIGLLQRRLLPSQAGISNVIDNYGTMRNGGAELGLQLNLLQSEELTLSTRFNISRNKTVLVDLGEKTTPDYVRVGGNLLDGVMGILQPGEEIGRFFGYKITGLAQAEDFGEDKAPLYPYPEGGLTTQIPGTWKYQDTDGNGTVNADDRVLLGKSNPAFVFGWNTDFTWKKFGLNLLFTGSYGNDLLNLTRIYLNDGFINYYGVIFNQTEEWYEKRWRPENPHNDARYPGTQLNINGGDALSVMVEDGSFLRLKTLTLSYDLASLGKLKNARVFLTGTNVFTMTRYTGFDPEVSSFNQSLLQQGVDYGAYPSQRSYTLGLAISF